MAGNRRYDARHLSTAAEYQVQMTNWFEIQIEDVSEDITFMARSVSLPEESNQQVDLAYGNSSAHVAGPVEYGSNTLTIMDSIQKDIEQQLIQWRSQVYDVETGKMGWVDQYKRKMTVTQYGPDGTHERTWQFNGAWPQSISYGDLDYSSADAKTISITLVYDYAKRL